MRKQSLAGCWGRCFCLMASTWYQSIGYFAVLWYIDKCQTPQARTIDSLPQCNLLFEYHPQAGCNCSSIIPPLLMLAMRIYYHVEKKSSTLRGEGCFYNNWPGNWFAFLFSRNLNYDNYTTQLLFHHGYVIFSPVWLQIKLMEHIFPH